MNRFLQIGIYLILVIAVGLTILFTYWITYPYRVLEIKGDKFPVLNENKTVKRGDSLVFVSDNCKFMDITAQTTRAFVNHIIYYVPTTTTNVRKGCGEVTISVPVSITLPLGKYYLQNIFQYKVNPVRTITIEHNTEEFEVIK